MNSIMVPLQALWLMLLLVATSLAGSTTASQPSGLRLELSHIDSKGNFTKSQLMRRAAHRSRLRAAMRSAKHGGSGYNPATTSPTWDTRSQLRYSGSEYIFNLAIGTPPLPYVALADTGSDLIWTQSQPCTHCSPQSTPIYNPFLSRSFSLEPCSSVMCQGTKRFPIVHQCSNATHAQLCRYFYGYGDGAFSKGVMGRETLTFRGSRPGTFVSVAGIAFGCSNDNKGEMFNSTGTVGLGRGPLSLVAQLGFGKFSYCLTDYFNTKLTSPLLFGSLADLTAGGRGGAAVQSTPLLHVPQSATYYYVSLEGISIGGNRLPIPKGAFELKGDGTGGAIFDSGTSFTSLQERAFKVVVGYIDKMLGLLPSNVTDLKEPPCYQLEQPGAELPEIPDMVLHFAEGADMRLHRDNYMHFFDDKSQLCLLMTGDPDMSTIGNYQQQNMHVLYDTTEGYLSFVPADCSKL